MYQKIEVTISELDPDNLERLTEVSQLIRDKGHKETSDVIKMTHAESEREAENARAVLMELGDLAITPMLNQLNFDKPADLVWDLETVVSFQLENRSKIVKLLDELLEETTVVPSTLNPLEVEEMPPTMRLCDHAYLLMRQLFALEDENTEFINRDLYLNLTDDERDDEIALARDSKKWSNLTEVD